MKVTLSLPEDDVEFRTAQLATAYEDAWESWATSGHAKTWETVTGSDLGA